MNPEEPAQLPQPMPSYNPEPTPPLTHRLQLPIILGIVLVVVVGAVSFMVLHKSDNKSSNTSSQANAATFKNQLTPTSEIKVGNYRYVSPCQALPFDSVKSIFKSVNDDTYVSEESLPVSLPVDSGSLPAKTSCEYKLSNGTVTLYATQYGSKDKLFDPQFTFTVKDTDIQKTIDSVKKFAGTNSDDKALVTAMQKGLATYKKGEDAYYNGDSAATNMNGIIAPDVISNDRLNFMYGNVLYGIEIAGEDSSSDALTAAQYGEAYKAIQTVTKNAANKQLDQSPINTILGSTNKLGNTKLLEPCSLIDAATFQAATGQTENSLLDRTTLPVNVSKVRYSLRHTVNDPQNTCTRNYDLTTETGDDEASNSNSFKLTLSYLKSADKAKQFVQTFITSDGVTGSVPLQTDADSAYAVPSPLQSDAWLYIFQVGPYVVNIDITGSYSAGLSDSFHDSEATQAQYVQAINAVTANIKKQ